MKTLFIDRTRCNGCGACQAVCALVKRGAQMPQQARIRVRRAGGPAAGYVTVCQHCAQPVCLTACMRGIIDQDPATGLVTRRTQGCFTCAACKVMCPSDSIVYDSLLDAFVTCDLCGGDPPCAKACPTGALRYEDQAAASEQLRQKYAQAALGGKGAR